MALPIGLPGLMSPTRVTVTLIFATARGEGAHHPLAARVERTIEIVIS